MPADEKSTGQKRGIWSRRDFFTRLGWGGFSVFSGLTLLGFMRSDFPRVLFKPPSPLRGENEECEELKRDIVESQL